MSKPYIPIETQKRMHAFFMKTIGPRLTEELIEETEKALEKIRGPRKKTM